MKRTILLLISFCFALLLNAQVSKTATITAGGLSSSLTTTELSTVTNLTLTGTIDARDFKTMRDNMPLLAELDLSGATIEAYTGTEGTAGTGNIDYPANHIPQNAFYNNLIWQGKTSLTSIVLPTTATYIGDVAFGYCSGLVSMTISSSVISIGQFAFRNCSDLPIITIPSSVTSIGWGAFYEYGGLIAVDTNNSNYSSIDGVLFNKDQTTLIKYPISKTGMYIIPSSVTTVGNYAFYGCSGLTSITIPTSVITIEQFAFGGCSSLTSIIIPSSVTFIGADAFWACSSLTSITIPSSVITIESFAFNVCSGLITVDENNPNYSSIDGVLFNKNKSSLIHCPTSKTGNYSIPSSVSSITPYAFVQCRELVSIIIPSSVTSIGDYTFSGCSALISVNLPSSINSIGNAAFYNCSGLSSIFSNSSIPVDLSLSVHVFEGINKTNCTLYVPYGSKAAYQAANQWQDFTNIVEASEGFSLGSNTANLGAAEGSNTTVDVTANVAWTASSDKTWLTIIPTSGIGNQTLTFTAEANPTIGTRAATVTVSAPDIEPQTITVTQASTNLIKNGDFVTDGGLPVHWGWWSRNGGIEPTVVDGVAICVPGNATPEYWNYGFHQWNLTAQPNVEYIFSFTAWASGNRPMNVVFVDNAENNYNRYGSSGDPEAMNGRSEWLVHLTSVPTTFTFHVVFDQMLPNTFQDVAFYLAASAEVVYIDNVSLNSAEDLSGLKLSATTANITATEGSTATVDITSNVAWTASSNQSWLAVNPTSGTGNNTLNFTAGANPSIAPRRASVTVLAAAIPQTITVTQAAGSDAPLNVTAGSLSSALTAEELATVTKLTLTGTIDARDFKTMRDDMPLLAELDLSAATIAAYNGTEGTSPYNLNYPVNTIPERAFHDPNTGIAKESLTSVSFPSTITKIGRYAFRNCIGLAAAILPSSLTIVDYGAFYGCSNLSLLSVEAPSSLTIIGMYAFRFCSKIASVSLPSSLTTLDYGAFFGCSNLSSFSVESPSSLTAIGIYAFGQCSKLTEFAIQSTVTTIGNAAFLGTNAFISVDAGNSNYSSSDGVLYDKNKTRLMYCPSTRTGDFAIPSTVINIAIDAFYNCSGLTSINIPSGLKTIEDWAFENCTGLTTISVPSSVSFIGNNAFYNCIGLTSFYANSSFPVDLSSRADVFFQIDKTACTLFVPYGSKTAYQSAAQWQDFANIVEATEGFSLSSNTANIAATAGSTATVDITANVAWSASSDQTWLTVSPTSGSGNQSLTFTAEANTSTTEQRMATVTVSATDIPSQTITVTQQMTIDPTKLDAFEPDNAIAEASTITSGMIQQHSIYPFGDEDYTSFELTNAPAEVTIQFLANEDARQLQLIAPDGTSVLRHEWDYIGQTLTENGTYYIRAWNPDNQLVDSYQLSLSIKPIVPDKYEPDNTWEQATAILPFFEQDDHNIKIWDDVDYFKFTVSDAPRTVYVDVFDTRRNCNSFGVWLYDTDGTTQLNYNYTAGQMCGYSQLQQNITTNGTYFVKVAVPQGWGGMRDNYTIKVTTDGTAPVIECNAGDRAALVAIYNALNGPNWNNKQGWLTDNVQDWQGVTLNPEGRVTKLNLTRNNLRGTIPTEIGNLTALRYLNLGNDRYVENWNNSNYLNGSVLPASLSNLVNLEVLSLDQLQFNTELPDVFSGMVNLRELYLNENYFTNAQLPTGILNCSKLERLDFSYNNFSQLPNLTSLTNIQEIQAYMNRLTFEDLEPNATLLGFNYWDQAKIGQPLGLNPEPGTLFSQTIEVGGEHNLYQWYKDNQPMEGQTSNTLTIQSISTADAGIYELRVTNTVATQLTLTSEPVTLYKKEMPLYKSLEAFYNSTGGPNWNNNTNWLSDEPFTSWFGIYQDYEWNSLQLYNNNLIGQLPASMGDLTIFNGIYIQYNPQLSGSIPESIGNLAQLQSLSLHSNGLTGEIPSSIGNLKNVSYLEFSNNQLTGSVPATITECTNLYGLYLYDNQIENLPDLSAMPNLWDLYVSNNRFQFDDLTPTLIGKPNMYFSYDPQKKFGNVELYNKQAGEALTLTATCGGTGNLYQWYKDGNLLDGKTANTLVFDALALTDRGSYVCKVTNPSVPNLTLESEPMSIVDPTLLDAFEPDNAIAQASTITSGVMQQHSIYPIGDVDYASFELTNAPAEVTIQFLANEDARQLQLIAPDGTSVLRHEWDYIGQTLTENGTYYIRAWNPDNQLVDSYQLSLSIKPIVLDKYEPDNTWEQATAILPFFEQDDHNIKANGDVDYVKFTVSDAPRTVYVDVFDTRRNCNSFGVWLYDTDGTTELNYSSWGGNYCGAARLEQNITANGTYFVKVAVPQYYGGMRENYTIKVTTDGTAPVIECNADDRAALVAIYNALNGPNWNNKQGWLTDNVQNWHGVTLNAEGRVTKLNLTQNNLQGTIPSEIGNLTALRYLNLGNDRYVENWNHWNHWNNLNGSTLPVSMANLANLEVLSLDQLQFNTELPDVFSGMVNLSELYLNGNYFTNAQLPTGILNCSKLERLDFSYNNFSQLPNLTSLTNIQEIQAYMNRLTFEDLEPNATLLGFNYWDQAKIGQPLGLNPEPGSTVSQTIEVGGEHNLYQWYKNDLPLEGQTSNTLQIENVSTADAGIYELRVTNTVATQLTLYSEPIALYQKELPIYKALEAFYNSTGGPNWNNNTNWLSDAPFSSWFGIYQDNEWNSLQMFNNNLVGQLPAGMGDLTIFNGIYIQYNPQLTGSIPESIGNLKNLNYLELSNNQLTGSVPATITECTNLYRLYLQNNQIENLPDLSAMPNLWDLYVSNNRFQFDDLAPTRTGKPYLYFPYDPQAKFGQVEVYTKQPGEALTLTAIAGGTGNLYQWYKDGNLLDGKTANTLVFDALALTDRGSYVCKVTNPSVPNLTLESEPMSIVDPSLLDAFEPDNTIAQASTIASGDIQEHNIYPIGDVDYAKFELTNAPVNIDVQFIASSGSRNIQIIAPDGTTVLTWDYERSYLTLTQNGTYYIRAWNPDNQLVDSYQLSLNIIPIIWVTQISLTDGTITTDNGTLQMVASILPADATNQNLIWTVENGTGTAIIDTHTGLLTARMSGTVTVKAKATDGTGVESTAIVTISGQVPQLTDFELIRNGNFIPNGGLPYPWGFWSGNGGSEPTVVSGFAVCTPSQHLNIWYYQFNQSGLEALPNTDYIFTFTAWADAERQITVDFEDTAENNYNRYGSSSDSESRDGISEWTFGITTVPTTYTFHVNFDKMVPSTIQKVNFMLAASSEVVYLDRVSLNSVSDYQLVNPLIANAGPDQAVPEGELVTLDGSASYDSKASTLTYLWTAPEGITLSSATVAQPTFTAPEVLANNEYTFTLVVNNGIWDSPADQVVITVNNINRHFTPIWTGNGVDHMNMNIYSAKLDGVELEAGDEIGIFDGTICVGVGTLTEPITSLNTLDIVVSKNDGSGNGYTPGNAITFKLFDKSENLEMTNVAAIYSNTDPSWSTDGKFAAGVSAFAELSGLTKVTQDIILNTGWNIISANVIPANLNLKDLFQSLIDAGKLKKVMDEAGKTIENFGAFGGWKNNIGNLNSAKGYKVNVTATSTLSLEGTPVSLPLDIALATGWNIISYPSATAQDAKALVQSLIDAGKLKKVMDESGKTIENFGAFGGWKNNIGNFAPGKGYKVNVLESCTITIPADGTKSVVLVPEVLASTYFNKVFTGNGTDHMSINLVNLQASGLQAGDEIGVFDGESCVGSAMIGSEQMIAGSISIPASANDDLEMKTNGFTTGNRVKVKLYRDGQTFPLELTKLDGQDVFDKNASLLAQASKVELTGSLNFGEEVQFRCYPNPFTEQITIEIQSAKADKLEVNIFDINGKLVRKLFNGQAENSKTLIWDGRNESGAITVPGTYLINANGKIDKVILKNKR